MFCPKCGSIMMPKKQGAKKVLVCGCGHKSEGSENALKEEVKPAAKEVEVVDEDYQVHPLVEEKCPECSHPKAFFWSVQTRASDEPATKFFKCEKCKHTWRDYS